MRHGKAYAAFPWITTSIIFAKQLPSTQIEFKQYCKAGCYEADRAVLVNGEMKALEQPIISRCKR